MRYASILLVLVLTACETLGPRAVRQGRNDYNSAIADTNSEQFLLNIVRVRYNDTPYVLDISSISSRLEFESQLSGSTSTGNRGDGAGARVAYAEKPTIIYQPLRGKDFVRQLMTPVDLNTLVLLRQSGFEIDDILRVFANEINGVPNAPTAADSTPEGVPEFSKFLEASQALDEIEDSGDLVLAPASDQRSLILEIKPRQRESQNFLRFCELLNLDPAAPRYHVSLGIGGGGGNKIVIETRPILSAMFFVGQAIDIPEAHVNRVHMNYDEDGKAFDWREVHQELIQIRSSESAPEDASVMVPYKDHWFYVAGTDVDTRETLTMLSVVFTLQAGSSSSRDAPVLTIPVN
jgi:hypothetical protein